MPRRTPLLTLPLLAAALAAGCGGSDAPTVAAADAQSAVERAAKIRLATTDVSSQAKDEGLLAAASNAATATTDKQIAFVFTLKDAGTVDKLRGKLASSVPGGGVKVLTHANVVVVYGATGSDHTGAVTTAVQSLG